MTRTVNEFDYRLAALITEWLGDGRDVRDIMDALEEALGALRDAYDGPKVEGAET